MLDKKTLDYIQVHQRPTNQHFRKSKLQSDQSSKSYVECWFHEIGNCRALSQQCQVYTKKSPNEHEQHSQQQKRQIPTLFRNSYKKPTKRSNNNDEKVDYVNKRKQSIRKYVFEKTKKHQNDRHLGKFQWDQKNDQFETLFSQTSDPNRIALRFPEQIDLFPKYEDIWCFQRVDLSPEQNDEFYKAKRMLEIKQQKSNPHPMNDIEAQQYRNQSNNLQLEFQSPITFSSSSNQIYESCRFDNTEAIFCLKILADGFDEVSQKMRVINSSYKQGKKFFDRFNGRFVMQINKVCDSQLSMEDFMVEFEPMTLFKVTNIRDIYPQSKISSQNYKHKLFCVDLQYDPTIFLNLNAFGQTEEETPQRSFHEERLREFDIVQRQRLSLSHQLSFSQLENENDLSYRQYLSLVNRWIDDFLKTKFDTSQQRLHRISTLSSLLKACVAVISIFNKMEMMHEMKEVISFIEKYKLLSQLSSLIDTLDNRSIEYLQYNVVLFWIANDIELYKGDILIHQREYTRAAKFFNSLICDLEPYQREGSMIKPICLKALFLCGERMVRISIIQRNNRDMANWINFCEELERANPVKNKFNHFKNLVARTKYIRQTSTVKQKIIKKSIFCYKQSKLFSNLTDEYSMNLAFVVAQELQEIQNFTDAEILYSKVYRYIENKLQKSEFLFYQSIHSKKHYNSFNNQLHFQALQDLTRQENMIIKIVNFQCYLYRKDENTRIPGNLQRYMELFEAIPNSYYKLFVSAEYYLTILDIPKAIYYYEKCGLILKNTIQQQKQVSIIELKIYYQKLTQCYIDTEQRIKFKELCGSWFQLMCSLLKFNFKDKSLNQNEMDSGLVIKVRSMHTHYLMRNFEFYSKMYSTQNSLLYLSLCLTVIKAQASDNNSNRNYRNPQQCKLMSELLGIMKNQLKEAAKSKQRQHIPSIITLNKGLLRFFHCSKSLSKIKTDTKLKGRIFNSALIKLSKLKSNLIM